ncbi:hypothetical protein ACFU8Q_36900 [Streptomyces sp. NPDC057543]|uniref:hypothetical protein n=1 Tax=Streptomyces sp. NPDC057543 TaxID=3346163 RepID=UPI0036B2E693
MEESIYGSRADGAAEGAKSWRAEEEQTPAIGEGLAAIAYALLDVAAAIRENTEARQR